jgi:CheY-like chemotaxis protein
LTRPSRLPAIALTAYARTEDRRDALAAGFDGYVSKPVESRGLLAAITTLVRARRSTLSAIS